MNVALMNATSHSTVDVDLAVLGSGFAGSLTALCASRCGRTVALIDNATHPRFAIGESSTPIADRLLRRLGEEYGIGYFAAMSTCWPGSSPTS